MPQPKPPSSPPSLFQVPTHATTPQPHPVEAHPTVVVTVVCLSHPKAGQRDTVVVGIDAGHEQGTVAVEVMVMSNCACGHTSLFLLSLTGHANSGRTVEMYLGQVGRPDAVAVPFEVVGVAKVELERVCLLRCLASERGRALGGGMLVLGLGDCGG